MKSPDLKSTLLAGLFGLVLLFMVSIFYLQDEDKRVLGIVGFIIGAGVQTLVRLTGVS